MTWGGANPNVAIIISTHTLTWSVTTAVNVQSVKAVYFNSHAHVERDGFGACLHSPQSHFNSHAHVERDRLQAGRSNKFFNFNSHAHVERDKIGLRLIQFFAISTHTLTWSVTSVESGALLKMLDFNSHAHVERDAETVIIQWSNATFQLTRSRGA